MANPQVEDGHVDIANEIIDELAKYRLSGEEWQCLLVIWRKTYGWHKKEDEISLSTFEVMTGIKRPNVVRTLKKLVSKKIIGSSEIDTRYAKRYWFVKDFEQWEPVIKKDTTSINKDTPQVSIKITRPVSIKIPSKENSSKETITKEKTLSPQSLQLAGKLAERVLGNNPKHRELSVNKKDSTIRRWSEDIDKMNRLDHREWQEISDMIEWCQNNDFWKSNILSASKLRIQFDAMAAKMVKKNSGGITDGFKKRFLAED